MNLILALVYWIVDVLVIRLARLVFDLGRGLGLLAACGSGAYWWWSKNPIAFHWLIWAVAATFVAFVLRYLTFWLEAKLLISMRRRGGVALGYNL